ncbi:MAG: regulatory iron-sulfur-containing complex subunit RicT [Phycisphaerales bacterium]|nr:regulatory iron-sulfur-containing complex subunit RicT [Phycisphaerales bacterium]
MSCASCSTKDGKSPGGCKNNGSCSTGSCNRMNVYDWLQNLPSIGPDIDCRIIEVSFNQGSRKEYYKNFNINPIQIEKGAYVTVEVAGGFDVGHVSLKGELVRLQLKKLNLSEVTTSFKNVLRLSTPNDLASYQLWQGRRQELLARSRTIAKKLNLKMKLSEIEVQADGKKAIFYYTADDRVDFRELIKSYAQEFKFKIEMKQIGMRQEAAKLGGIGSCGRELCCSTWLTDFKSVNTAVVRYQSLSINQVKLSGQCGRLKCCLNYELDTYLDALQKFPENAQKLETASGVAHLIKKDIFSGLMWYSYKKDNGVLIPYTIDKVKNILELNAKGIKNAEAEVADIASHNKPKGTQEPVFVDVVGQTSLKSLNSSNRSHKKDKQWTNKRPNPKQNTNNRAPHPAPKIISTNKS